jgi:16S rRNA (guanine1516-N2)-methyltransferase
MLPACSVHFSEKSIYLMTLVGGARLSLELDFVGGAQAYRRKFGGGKSQAIAKAVGITRKYKPSVLDCTAGQGRDAFVLASLGARLTMIERSPVAHLLLQDAMDRAATASQEDQELADIMSRMMLLCCSAHDYLPDSASQYDVVYLDPMFPERKKAALVKKEMQVFHQLIGTDSDADALLDLARARARYRVVVKRPKGAPTLAGETPTYVLPGKASRFDIYVNAAMPKE